MMSEDDKKTFLMSPYHDMHSPFSVGEMGNFAEYIAHDLDNFPELILGSFALIRDWVKTDGENAKNVWLVARIIELKAISPFNPKKETALYAEDEEHDPTVPLENVFGPHTHQPMIARVRLERQMFNEGESKEGESKEGESKEGESKEGESKRRFVSLPVQRPPSARSKMQFPDILPQENDAPCLREMLEIPDKGITLGYVGQGNEPFQGKSGEFLPYKWNVDNLDNKHIFIIGESGSGKTVLLKNLAYELRRHKYSKSVKPRILMTDVQGDIAQLLTDGLEKTHLTPKGWQSKVQERQPVDEAMKELGPFRLVIPATRRDPSDRLVALKELAQKQGHGVEEIGLRMQDLDAPSDVEYLYRVTSEQVAILLDKIAEKLKDVKQEASLEKLKQSVQRLQGRKKLEKILVGDTHFLGSTLDSATRALLSLEGYFDHHQLSIGGENPLNKLDFDGVVILYMDDLNYDERVMWEMQLVKWLYEKRREKWNAFVFFDEAHQIIPAKPPSIGSTATFDRLRRNFELLAREGRKFGINLVLGTQSPRDLHPIVPEQCPTKIVMKISPQNAAIASLDKELAGIAARFGAGQFFITSPFNGVPDWVRVHSDAPPLPHMSMTAYWDIALEEARKINSNKKN